MEAARVGNQQHPAAAGGEGGYGGGVFLGIRILRQDDQQGGGGAQPFRQAVGILEIGYAVTPAGYPGQQGWHFLRDKVVAVGGIHQQQPPVGGDFRGENRSVGKDRRLRRVGNGGGKVNIRGRRRSVAAAGIKEQVRRQEKDGGRSRKEQQQQGFTERRRHTGNKTPAD